MDMTGLLLIFGLMGVCVAALLWVITYSEGTDKYLRIILVTGLYHLVFRMLWPYLYANEISILGTPISLLYGPMLYMAYMASVGKPLSSREQVLHGIPFVLSVAFIGVYRFLTLEVWFTGHYDLFFLLSAVSFTVYPAWIGYRKNRLDAPVSDTLAEGIIGQLSAIYVVSALFITLLIVGLYLMPFEFGFDLRLLIFGILFTGLLLIVRYTYLKHREKNTPAVKEPVSVKGTEHRETAYQHSGLDEEVMKRYSDRLDDCLQTSGLYLKPNLSLDMLSRETGIPKHHLSQLFNTYLGKNFYQLMAEYRINYGVRRIEQVDEGLTIESLAYECGFNSKSSFNQYFKEYTGCTPSEYRSARCQVSA